MSKLQNNSDYILNEVTGRYVKKTSKIGSQIVQQKRIEEKIELHRVEEDKNKQIFLNEMKKREHKIIKVNYDVFQYRNNDYDDDDLEKVGEISLYFAVNKNFDDMDKLNFIKESTQYTYDDGSTYTAVNIAQVDEFPKGLRRLKYFMEIPIIGDFFGISDEYKGIYDFSYTDFDDDLSDWRRYYDEADEADEALFNQELEQLKLRQSSKLSEQ